MLILSLKIKLHAPWVHSLKEKRMVVKSLLSKMRNKFNVAVAEVGEQDIHQTIVTVSYTHLVQIFPNEILGSAQKAIELTQTGAIDFVVAGTANLETFAGVYEIFSMPYLFDSEDVYKSVMQDTDYMEKVYESTDEAGFRVVTWYNAGVRNFYAKTPIHTPDDLKGKKMCIRDRLSGNRVLSRSSFTVWTRRCTPSGLRLSGARSCGRCFRPSSSTIPGSGCWTLSRKLILCALSVSMRIYSV